MVAKGKEMKVLGLINTGGFGRVDKVRLDDGSVVARKTFQPADPYAYTDSELAKMKLRFKREVEVQSLLRGNFVPVLDSNLHADPPWFTMPLASQNFEAQIQADRKANTITIGPLADVLNGLEQMHLLGYVHRDLKPANVLQIGKVWCLSDFGLVRPTTSATTKLTASDSAWGTESYCAPEQKLDFRHVTPAADIRDSAEATARDGRWTVGEHCWHVLRLGAWEL